VQFVRTASSYDNYGLAIGAFMRWAGWTRATVLASSDALYANAATSMAKTIKRESAVEVSIVEWNASDSVHAAELEQVRDNGDRIFVVLADPTEMFNVAHFLGNRSSSAMLGLSSIDILQPLYASAPHTSIEFKNPTLSSALDGWLFLSPMKAKSTTSPTNRTAITATARLSDAIVLYAHGVQRVLNRSGNVRNGTAVVEAMLSESFAGETGMVHLDSNGDLVESYSVFNYVLQDGVLSSVLVGECGGGLSSSDAGCAIKQKVRWPGGSSDVPSATRTLPLHRPPDHAHMHRCKRTNTYCAG
jgi:hypothetical protein